MHTIDLEFEILILIDSIDRYISQHAYIRILQLAPAMAMHTYGILYTIATRVRTYILKLN
jgi:hypothetical protein